MGCPLLLTMILPIDLDTLLVTKRPSDLPTDGALRHTFCGERILSPWSTGAVSTGSSGPCACGVADNERRTESCLAVDIVVGGD